MNIMFWALTVVMLLVAIALLVYPLLKVRQSSSIAYKESNLKINEEKIKELDQDLKDGRIDQAFYKAARDELDRELLIDIPEESRDTAAQHYVATAKRHPTLALLISVFIPMMALLLYLDLGMHSASDEAFIASQQQSQQPPSIEELAKRLEAKIEKEGGTVQDWVMLGRAHKYMGKNELAAKAFTVALEQDANNAQLMLELAEVMALNNDRQFTAESRELVMKAYELEPDNANVLWFAGVAEYQQGNYHQAISHLLHLLPLAKGEEEVMQSLISIIAQSRQQLIDAGEKMPELEEMLGVELTTQAGSQKGSSADDAITAASTTAAVSATSLNVTVEVADIVHEKFDASDVIFVYAKAKQGPRMPLAAQRMTLAELPATIVLDDSMAMVEGVNLSAFNQLVVSARVTKSGSAIAQSGDYIGRVEVENTATNTTLNVVIDTAIP